MFATLNGEVRHVEREHRGVIWCPFCDRSRQITKDEMWCDGCHGQFSAKLFDWLNQVSIFNSAVTLAPVELEVLPAIKKGRKPKVSAVDAVL